MVVTAHDDRRQRGRGTETAYPAGGTASHLNGDPTLSSGEIDTTSFKISTSATTPSEFFVQIVAIWEFESETYRYHPGGIDVRVVDYNGEQFELLSNETTASSIGDGCIPRHRHRWT